MSIFSKNMKSGDKEHRKSIGVMLPLILDTLFKKPVTTTYPKVKADIPDGFRGKLKFYPDRCIGCKMCERDCPSDAIEITKIEPENEGGKRTFSAELHLDRCIFCGQCADSCPKDAIEITPEFELARLTRKELSVDPAVRTEE